jgi:hypothetical protein
VGHNFSLESFSEAHSEALERALWVALRKLNEQMALNETLAKVGPGSESIKSRHRENAASAEHDMHLLHDILARL